MNYLQDLATRPLKSFKKGNERFTSFSAGIGWLANIDPSFYSDLIRILISCTYPDLVRLASLITKTGQPYSQQKNFNITKIERVLRIDRITPPSFSKSNIAIQVLQIAPSVYEVQIGETLIITLTTHLSSSPRPGEMAYQSATNRILLRPLFQTFNTTSNTWETAYPDLQSLIDIIQSKDQTSIYRNNCFCGNKIALKGCCKYLFMRPESVSCFGFCELEILDYLDNHVLGNLELSTLKKMQKAREIPKNQLTRMVGRNVNPAKTLRKLSVYPITYYEGSKIGQAERINQWIRTSATMGIESLWVVKDTRGVPIHTAASNEQKDAQLADWIKAQELFDYFSDTTLLLEKILVEKNYKKIAIVIDDWKCISVQHRQDIKVALKAYLGGSPSIGSHILLTKIEPILKDIVEAMGLPIIHKKSDGLSFEYKMLGELINLAFSKSEVHSTVGKVMSFTLTSKGSRSLNLRNEIAHSFEGKRFTHKEFLIGFLMINFIGQSFS